MVAERAADRRVIPATGDPIIVTPFFESPHQGNAGVPAEIRTWQEDEEPLKLVADFLASAARRAPVGFEETNRFFISTG
jgi:Xaa-Pro dipeptidase